MPVAGFPFYTLPFSYRDKGSITSSTCSVYLLPGISDLQCVLLPDEGAFRTLSGFYGNQTYSDVL